MQPVTSRPGVDHFPGPIHHRSTILSALGPDYALTVLFLGTHTRTSQWVTHHEIALARYSLNFGVPMESEASELPKSLVLGRDENIHLRITPLGDVGCYNPGADHFPGPLHHRSTILSALGLPFPHGFVFGNSRATSEWVTHPGNALASFSLNFGVPTKSEASELPKGLVLEFLCLQDHHSNSYPTK
ncbi:hypothetical protein DVH24_034262 [Malus domestica]|uniref:Uncharacterized protein n=1 Tax=Malus domestica TaxID=3750 RepID=A0A498J076_MALDO|nr:hypothetical protein DVH24_034262 [Malus domestica]